MANNIPWTPPPSTLYLPIILILACLTVMVGVITITLTALYNKAKTEDRQDKISYISDIWVGSRSGFLHSMMLLWCPVMIVLAFYGPVRTLLPWKDRIYSAAEQLSDMARVAKPFRMRGSI